MTFVLSTATHVMEKKRVLGFDPGLNQAGFGLIVEQNDKPHYVISGVLTVNQHNSLQEKLAEQRDSIEELLNTYQPECCVIEDVFIGKHPQAALRLGMAQAVLLIQTAAANIPVFQYASTRVKKNITGKGHASKELVGRMACQHLSIRGEISHHASDSLALALCHFYETK